MARRRRWGRIRRLPSGRHQARYPGPDGTLHPAPHTFPTKTDAEIWLTDKEAELRRDGWQDPTAGREALGKYARRWLDERPDLARSTRAKYESFLRNHVGPQLGNIELRCLTTARLRSWRAERLTSLAPKGGPTVAGTYRFLRAVLNTAVSDRAIRENPCRIVGADRDGSPERPTVTIPDVYAIADAIGERWRCLVLIAAFTSLRWAELVGLRRRDVHLDQGVIEVRSQLVEVNGYLDRETPKSEAGVRTVAIPPTIVGEIREHLREVAQPGSGGHLFVGARGGIPRRSDFNKRWHQAVKAAGVDVDPEIGLHLHDLRHTGNDLRSPGASLRDLMAHMGHSTQQAALVYQHVDLERQKAMARLVSEAIEAAMGHVGGTPPNDKTPDGDSDEYLSGV